MGVTHIMGAIDPYPNFCTLKKKIKEWVAMN